MYGIHLETKSTSIQVLMRPFDVSLLPVTSFLRRMRQNYKPYHRNLQLAGNNQHSFLIKNNGNWNLKFSLKSNSLCITISILQRLNPKHFFLIIPLLKSENVSAPRFLKKSRIKNFLYNWCLTCVKLEKPSLEKCILQ